MKARTIIHLQGGETIGVKENVDDVAVMVAQMARSAPGSAFQFERVNGHGALKRTFIPYGNITRIEEA